MKAFRKTPEGKAYDQTPERKAYLKDYLKAYSQTPKQKAYRKYRRQTPKYKAYAKAYHQDHYYLNRDHYLDMARTNNQKKKLGEHFLPTNHVDHSPVKIRLIKGIKAADVLSNGKRP